MLELLMTREIVEQYSEILVVLLLWFYVAI